MYWGMIENMLQKLGVVALLLTAGFLIGCGTSTTDPGGGSKEQTRTGVSETGYPGGQPRDAESPALGSSTEQKYARAEEMGGKENSAQAEK
jgi:hypothetical protein